MAGAHRVWIARAVLAALLAASVGIDVLVKAPVHAAANAGAQIVNFIAWTWYLSWRRGVTLRALIGAPPSDRREWWLVALVVPLIAFSVAVMLLPLYVFSWVDPERVRAILSAPMIAAGPRGPATLVLLSLAMAVVAGPVAEELLFRGALLDRWTVRLGARRAILATAALFGMLHLHDPFGAVAFGVAMALLRRRTGTLLVPIACHVVNNALVASRGAGSGSGSEKASASMPLAELREMGWVFVIVLLLAALVLVAFLRRSWPPKQPIAQELA